MEKNNNKHLLYAGLAIIIVIIIALVVPHLKKASAPTVDTSAPIVTPTNTTAASNTDNAWNTIFQKYNGKLVVFAEDCTSTPVVQHQTLGTTILLMNNSAVSHVFTISGTSYTVGGYHYKTTALTTKGTIAIGCDNSTDSTNIIVN